MYSLKNSFREILRYPSAVAGTFIILLLVVEAIYAVVAIPYQEAISLWRGGEEVWYATPKFAPPAWTNYFREKKLPVSFHMDSADGEMEKVVTRGESSSKTDITYPFTFEADDYPQELMAAPQGPVPA